MSAPDSLEIAGERVAVPRLGEGGLLVTFGQAIDPALNARVHALTRVLREQAHPDIVDLVPAYSSLLVRFDPRKVQAPELVERLKAIKLSNPSGTPHAPREHVIPVRYGGELGPDLQRIAVSRGLSTDEVISLHTAAEYRVYFLGFLPGFAYMGEVPPAIAAPRLPTPRVRVPAGSVAIAATQTAVYPFDSPGGWNIIGRTGVRLWNARWPEPALFSPGDMVRFVQSKETIYEAEQEAESDSPRSGRAAFEVVQPGILTTVQDGGRPGYGSLGVPEGGALDKRLASAANRLVGNEAGAPALEIVRGGPELLALRTAVVAVAGADLGCTVNGSRLAPGISWLVRAGQRIAFRGVRSPDVGELCYLAADGGLSVPQVLGSASTLPQAGMGGFKGRPLRPGDVLSSGHSPSLPSALAGKTSSEGGAGAPDLSTVSVIRYVPHVGRNSVDPAISARFATLGWRISPNSNRMGVRLESSSGENLVYGGGELLSFGVLRGAIQLPPGGDPIILGPDHGTTGGYPIIGAVIRADWPLLAQLPPGHTLRFEPVAVETALSLLPSD